MTRVKDDQRRDPASEPEEREPRETPKRHEEAPGRNPRTTRPDPARDAEIEPDRGIDDPDDDEANDAGAGGP